MIKSPGVLKPPFVTQAFNVAEKKPLHWHSSFGRVEVEEPLLRVGLKQRRPFCESSGVTPRGYSLPLQRIMVDFGADHAFGKAQKKLQEHYGLILPASSLRKKTLHHGDQMRQQQHMIPERPTARGCEQLIVETDGSFVPVMTPNPDCSDQRKGKTLHWQEAKLSLAYQKGSVTPKFGVSFQRGPSASGKQWLRCAILAGLGQETAVHGVGDGAKWIINQMKEQFGTQGTYLVDFYHACEYLAAAASFYPPDQADAWIARQKQQLKQSQYPTVISQIARHAAASNTPNEAEVGNGAQAAYRYFNSRIDQLDYQRAIIEDLPIGSGEIESAHRYVIQERMKLPGAWWNAANIESMLALRVERANNEWQEYWQQQGAMAEAA